MLIMKWSTSAFDLFDLLEICSETRFKMQSSWALYILVMPKALAKNGCFFLFILMVIIKNMADS